VATGLAWDMRIEPDDSPVLALKSECKRAFAVWQQFGKNRAQIPPIIVITGDYPATMYPIAERFAQHLVCFECLILCQVTSENQIIEIVLLAAHKIEHGAKSSPCRHSGQQAILISVEMQIRKLDYTNAHSRL
jgi:hypothetical protein